MAHSVAYGQEVERLEPSAGRSRRSRARFVADEIRGPYPELRIISAVDFEASADWDPILNKIGSQNRGKGIARSLGSMSLTIVSAQEAGKMLGDKHGPAYFNNRGSALDIMYRFAKKFNRYVARQMREAIEFRVEASELAVHNTPNIEQHSPAEGLGGYDSSSDIVLAPNFDEIFSNIGEDENDEIDNAYSVWEPLSAKVKGIDTFSRNAFGLDLSGDRMLASRISSVKDYVRHEGLPTHFIDPNRTAHLTFFDVYPHLRLGHLTMKSVELGRDIVLGPPEAVVNPNGNIQ